MPKIIVFNNVSLDGYIADASGDMSWAHKQDAEWTTFISGNAKGKATFLFGRVTYQMMADFWPTPEALKLMPDVAKSMNGGKKIVFSRTLSEATWSNTTLLKGDLPAAVRKLKKGKGPDLVVFGSASIVAQLAGEGLVDEFQLAIHPVVLGTGKSMFAGTGKRIDLKTTRTRAFKNGCVLVCCAPAH
jgi:dihydrofolate reductase